jgi:hypothetical protein
MNLSCFFRAADTIDDIKSLAFFMRSWTSLQSCSSAKVALPNSSMTDVVVLPFCSSSAPSPNPLSRTDHAVIVATGATTAGTAAPPLLLLLGSSKDDGNDNDLTLTSKNDEITT